MTDLSWEDVERAREPYIQCLGNNQGLDADQRQARCANERMRYERVLCQLLDQEADARRQRPKPGKGVTP